MPDKFVDRAAAAVDFRRAVGSGAAEAGCNRCSDDVQPLCVESRNAVFESGDDCLRGGFGPTQIVDAFEPDYRGDA